MAKVIATHRDRLDSIGGSVMCVIRNAPAGLGEPTFHKLEATMSMAMMSIPAARGFEVGSGFDGCAIPGSGHNDPFMPAPPPTSRLLGQARSLFQPPSLIPKTNHSGGIQGGISNGAPIYFRVAFKSPATIGIPQLTTAFDLQPGELTVKGRFDPCIVPRAVPIVESMAALVLMDALLAQQARLATRALLPSLCSTFCLSGTPEDLTVTEKCERKLLNVKWRSGGSIKRARNGNDRVEDGERYRAR